MLPFLARVSGVSVQGEARGRPKVDERGIYVAGSAAETRTPRPVASHAQLVKGGGIVMTGGVGAEAALATESPRL